MRRKNLTTSQKKKKGDNLSGKDELHYLVANPKLETKRKDTIIEKYGNVAALNDEIPIELLLGQSERRVEYDQTGRIIKGKEVMIPKSKYEEVVHEKDHTTIWGSWWQNHQWGCKCCHQTLRNRYCKMVGAQVVGAEDAESPRVEDAEAALSP